MTSLKELEPLSTALGCISPSSTCQKGRKGSTKYNDHSDGHQPVTARAAALPALPSTVFESEFVSSAARTFLKG